MKILAVISSANQNGKGAELTRLVCERAAQHGAEIDYVYLYDLDFKGCGNCPNSPDDPGYCTKQDDLVPVLKKLVAADALVWSAPIYIGSISGTAKTFLDRFCIFVNEDITVNRTPGKKVIFLQTSGAPAKHYTAEMDKLCESLSGFFKMDVLGKLAVGELMSGSTALPEEIIAQARALGYLLSD